MSMGLYCIGYILLLVCVIVRIDFCMPDNSHLSSYDSQSHAFSIRAERIGFQGESFTLDHVQASMSILHIKRMIHHRSHIPCAYVRVLFYDLKSNTWVEGLDFQSLNRFICENTIDTNSICAKMPKMVLFGSIWDPFPITLPIVTQELIEEYKKDL
jgi:hypothetical protein